MFQQLLCLAVGHRFTHKIRFNPKCSASDYRAFKVESSCTRCNRLRLKQAASLKTENKKLVAARL